MSLFGDKRVKLQQDFTKNIAASELVIIMTTEQMFKHFPLV